MSTGYQLRTANDFRFIANRERITLFNAAGSLVCIVADSKRLMQGLAERAPSDGQYLYVPIDWRLPGVNVTQAIQPGWIIQDAASIAYVVQQVDPPGSYQGTYNCACLSLMAMGQVVHYVAAMAASSSTGSRTVTDTTGGTAYTCAIQPTRKSIQDLFRTKAMPETFDIWIATDPTGTGLISTAVAGDMLVDANGVNYEIQEITERLRIEELTRFHCIKRL